MAVDTKQIINLANDTVVCHRAVIADRPLRRMKGLIGRRELPSGEGLLLRPAPAIHTAFMRISIDALFLDADLQVIRIAEHLRPWRTAGKRRAWAVLEIAAGDAARRGVAIGDRLAVVDAAWDDGASGGDAAVLRLPGADTRARPGSARPSDPGADRDSMRLLLAARDRRFRSVASVLFQRRGCLVTTTADPRRATELVVRDGVDVVVLDAGSSLTAAAQTVAAIEALVPPVGVVLVADDAQGGLDHLRVLAKWGPFEQIAAAVDAAGRTRRQRSRLVG